MPETVWFPGGLKIEIHAVSDAFCLLVDHPPAGSSVPRHSHAAESETIHIAEGAYVVEVDGTETELSAGDTVHVPAGVPHAGRALGEGPVRRVIVFSPGGMECFFRKAGAADPRTAIDVAALLDATTAHGWRFG
jgi:uncharacterized RmlC-like cupin family protein